MQNIETPQKIRLEPCLMDFDDLGEIPDEDLEKVFSIFYPEIDLNLVFKRKLSEYQEKTRFFLLRIFLCTLEGLSDVTTANLPTTFEPEHSL
jgi:hypothetical protein